MFRSIVIIFKDSNSPKVIKIDRNMSELRHILCKKYNFNSSAFVGFIVRVVY